MSIRTKDDLYKALTDELAWRNKEIRDIRQILKDSRLTEARERLLLRAAVALLYAHWEGYVKKGGTLYLEFVHSCRLKNSELSPAMQALSARSIINRATGANITAVHLAVVKHFIDEGESKARIPYDTAIRTGNLHYRQFQDIVSMLELPLVAREVETKEKLIDEELLKNRNNIAHGDYLLINKERYLSLEEEIIGIITLFHNELLNATEEKRYLKTPTLPATAES